MNFKIIGAALVVTACGGCGFLIAASHHSRIRQFQIFVQVLDYMICELQYRATPLPLLCRMASNQCNGKLQQVLFKLAEELDAQISPNVDICMASVLDRIGELDPSIAVAFVEMGNQLGRFDLPGQIRGLESCRERCISKLEQMSANKDNRLRSYQTLGLCAGAAIAILFV